ncbi:hypothetical protein ACS5PN_19430 [Roseateles sp. NT4]|uniref:hypothetical protein n=1 Tax=Roseateles sp. NT4 TaxID=3453715 RepID=UPI003EF03DDE
MSSSERQPSSWRTRWLSFWRSLAPVQGSAEAFLVPLEDSRVEFHWKGRSVLLDQRLRLVLREGRVVGSFDKVLSVDVERSIDEDRPDEWTVLLRISEGVNVYLGSTKIDVDASIAAAKIATLVGAQVRSV